MKKSLEQELIDCQWIKYKCRKDKIYAQHLYAALCNIQWYTDNPKDYWSCTWRYAGSLVARLRCENGNYLDFYCGGDEGCVSTEIEEDLARLGWKWQEWPND